MYRQLIDTLKQLTSHPRNVVDPVIYGKESRYMHPFKLSLIGIFLIVVLNTLIIDFTIEPTLDLGFEGDEQLQEMAGWMEATNVRLMTQFLPIFLLMVFVPALALCGYFFYRDKTDGFYANLILNTYAMGVANFSLVLLIPAWLLLPYPLTDPFMHSSLPAILVAGIVIWIQKEYLMASTFMDWLKILSTYVLGFVLFSMLTNLLGGIIGFIAFSSSRILGAM